MNDSILRLQISAYSRQVAAVRSRRGNRSPAEYDRRDRRTGLRRFTTAAGGVSYGEYLANSAPAAYPYVETRTLGRAGFALQKIR